MLVKKNNNNNNNNTRTTNNHNTHAHAHNKATRPKQGQYALFRELTKGKREKTTQTNKRRARNPIKLCSTTVCAPALVAIAKIDKIKQHSNKHIDSSHMHRETLTTQHATTHH